MTSSICFTNCRVDLIRPSYLETVFIDGFTTPADLSIDTSEVRKHAEDLGYTDIRLMHIEHEVAHTFLSEAQGLPFSPVLYRVACGYPVREQDRDEEEALVFSFQRYLNKKSWDAARFDKFPQDIPSLASIFRARVHSLLTP